MSNSELQREFTLAEAISALRVTPEDSPWQAVAESWIQQHVAELEARPDLTSVHSKLDELLAWRRATDPGLCLRGFPSADGKFVARCSLMACHDGQHDNGRGDTWPNLAPPTTESDQPYTAPASDRLPCPSKAVRPGPRVMRTFQCSDKEGHRGAHYSQRGGFTWDDEAPKSAPTHPDPSTRLAAPDEEKCTGWLGNSMPGGAACARPRWHDGPHMDAVAIAHAGKAGEVWQ